MAPVLAGPQSASDRMLRYILAPAAERDIEQILAWSHEQFGERARLRYEALLVRAVRDVAEDPNRAGSLTRSEIAAGARTYHVRHSRDRVTGEPGRVSRPRHFLLYRTMPDGEVEIGRVLHDSMDLERHLTDEYRAPTEETDDTI
ncbi:MAG: type II toxin-antitoxin system RelE/ParE family toxin [Pirellulales bacterium]